MKIMNTTFYGNLCLLYKHVNLLNAKGGGVLQKCLLQAITFNTQIKEGGGGAEICFATVKGFQKIKTNKREVHS